MLQNFAVANFNKNDMTDFPIWPIEAASSAFSEISVGWHLYFNKTYDFRYKSKHFSATSTRQRNSILNWVLKLRKFFEALKSIFYMYLKWKDFKVTKFRIICNTCVLYSSKVPDATTWYISRLQSFFLANVLPLLRLVQ